MNPRTPEGPFNRALMVLGSGYLPLNPKPQTPNPKPYTRCNKEGSWGSRSGLGSKVWGFGESRFWVLGSSDSS